MATVSADIDRLQRRLASDGHRMGLPSNIAGDLLRVRRSLYRLQGVLTTVEKQPFEATNESLLWKIKQYVYGVEDILDEHEDGSIKPRRSGRGRKLADLCSQVIFSSTNSNLHCRMAKRMRKISNFLDHASEDSFIFSSQQHKADGDQSCGQDGFDETAIIGRDNDKGNLRALLLGNSQETFSIIPIVGLAGLGKTTLAQLIFNDQDERYNFDLRIWINLNMSCDLNSIASAIISEANRTEEGTPQVNEECKDNPQSIMNCLREVLHEKSCLIVLDGLWSTDEGQLLHLKKMLRGTQKNNKIIVTTCSENVANLMHTVRPYRLGPLSEENCWTIFSQWVFGDGDNSDLETIRKQIVYRCEGIPGLVHSLSSLVCDKGMSVWNGERQELWKLERQFPFQIKMFSSLQQIYYNMPSALKSCLSYLSLFPQGFGIRTENLIRQWAALGILGSTHGTLPVYSQGKKYIQELFSIFFLEAPHKSSGGGRNEASASKVLKMHNVVYEFARYVATHDLFILDGESKFNGSIENHTSRYARLIRCCDQSKIYKDLLTSVRAICLKNCGGAKLIEKVFSALKHLRVLDLSRCSFLELPSSICQLTHLKYIDISSSAVQSLPDQMSFLQNIEALDLSETRIQVLPDFIRSFQKLKYLSVQGCRELHHLPSKLDDIRSLQHLNLSCCPAAHQVLESVSGFQELRFLDISSCTELQTLPESFGRLTNLEDLILSHCSRLKKLPESFGELFLLQFLNISNCCELEEVPACLGKLANLEVLILSGCSRIQNLPQSLRDIAFLRVLDMAGCADLHMNLGMLPNNLENLNVDDCRKVYAMPGWTANFPKLHPECLRACEQHMRCLVADKCVCPSHDEVEISSDLNMPVHDETGVSANGVYPAQSSTSSHSISPLSGSRLSQHDSHSDHTYNSPPSASCLTKVADLQVKLKEIENAILGPELDITSDSPESTTSDDKPDNWRQLLGIDTGDLKQVIIACGKAVAENDVCATELLVSELGQLVSVSGDPMQRLGAYMLEGIVARLSSSGSMLYKSLKCKEPTSSELMSYMHHLYDICPFYKFGYMSANGAIVEATKGENFVHIIDFQIAQGTQWITVIQALAARPGGPPCIRITGIDDTDSAHARGGGLDIVGMRLYNVAQSCGLPFEFSALSAASHEIHLEHLDIRPGEVIAVNFAYQLHHVPDESVSIENHRDRIIRMIKSINPRVVTLVEQESNTNTAPFFRRYMETLDYYTAMFESIDVALPRDERRRISTEHCVARDIVNIIACEGAERVERHELFGKWKARFSMAGFRPYPLSSVVNSTIRALLQSYDSWYRLEERDGILYLGWKNRVLVVSSAWC